MRFTILLTLAALAAAAPQVRPNLSGVERDYTKTTGRLIVRLKPGTNLKAFDSALKADLAREASAGKTDNEIVYQYTAGFKGYAVKFNQAMSSKISRHPDVAAVEPDYIGYIDDIPTQEQQSPPSWGLSRISSRTTTTNAPYKYSSKAGEGVTAYILDTGVDYSHPEFLTDAGVNRTVAGISFIKDETTDLHGHGTHVAGTIAGRTTGLAKLANVVQVKACTRFGSCSTSDVVAGIQWIIKNAKKNKAVVNISLGLAPSQAIDDAVQAAVDAGIAIICSAGNANSDSCQHSPRRAPAAFVVGAIDSADKHADFSNWGKCLDIFAPGVDIVSARPLSLGGATQKMSGTSMASPHVAGVAALYLADREYTSIPDLQKDMLARGAKDVVKNLRNAATTTNILAYSRLFDAEEAKPETPATN